MPAPNADLLAEIERCYDAIPRSQGTFEEVGPFTLFVADYPGWTFYARPRLGVADFTAEDVRRVLARQAELGVSRAIEWVLDVTPSLLPAVQEVLAEEMAEEMTDGTPHELELCPLLSLPDTVELARPDPSVRVMTADDPRLADVLGAIHSGFGETDDTEPRELGVRPAAIAAGQLVVVGAFDGDGVAVGGGSAAPRGSAAELLGIATLPRARRRGVAGAVTLGLAVALRESGVTTSYLAAASDSAAGVYRSVGFERVGTAGILGLS